LGAFAGANSGTGTDMLKGIDQRLSAEVVHVLMLMGHGDDLVICDINHPAATIAKTTTWGKLIDMTGCDIQTATRAILRLMGRWTLLSPPRSAGCRWWTRRARSCRSLPR